MTRPRLAFFIGLRNVAVAYVVVGVVAYIVWRMW